MKTISAKSSSLSNQFILHFNAQMLFFFFFESNKFYLYDFYSGFQCMQNFHYMIQNLFFTASEVPWKIHR